MDKKPDMHQLTEEECRLGWEEYLLKREEYRLEQEECPVEHDEYPIEDQWDEEYFWEDFGLITLVLLGSIILNLLIFLDPLQWLLEL